MTIAVAVGSGAGTQEEALGLLNASNSVLKALRQLKYNSFIHKTSNTQALVPECDFVFNLCDNNEGYADSFVSYTSLLEQAKIPYTGNRLKCFKKYKSKLMWSSNSNVAKYMTFRTDDVRQVGLLECPFVVKHMYNHGSLSPVQIFKNVNSTVEDFLNTGEYFCEKFIKGQEISIAYLPGFKPMCGVKELQPTNILDFKTKWSGDITTAIYQPTSSETQQILEMIDDIKHALHITSYMRLDVRKCDDTLYLIDINPNCSLDAAGSFVKILQLNNISYETLIENIIKNDIIN